MKTAFIQVPCATRSSFPTSLGARCVSHVQPTMRSTSFLGRPTRAYTATMPVVLKETKGKSRVQLAPRMDTDEPNSSDKPTPQELAKLYGGSYLGTSIAMSIVSYAVLYALVYVGVDVRGITNAFGNWLATTPLGRPSALDNVSDAASAAAIAYVAHKVASPLRFPLTIAATPFVARIFSKKPTPGDSNSSQS